MTACGQKGGLYLPTAPEAANRATLPQTLIPMRKANTATANTSQDAAESAVEHPVDASDK